MIKIYFDSNANITPYKIAIKAANKCFNKKYNNPSSVHLNGIRSKEIIEISRKKIASIIKCCPEEIFFVSGATEAISWVSKMRTIVVSQNSHNSVFEAQKDCNPRFSYKPVICMPLVSSETGTLEKIENFDEIFLDLTAAIGKLNINLSEMQNVKYACFSSHKFGGILGSGVLFIRKDVQKYSIPLIYGSQENGLRGGTENFPAIYSMAIALEETYKNFKHKENKIQKNINFLYDYLKDAIKTRKGLNVLNITFKHLNAQTAINILNQEGIYVSAGSACMSGSDKPSNELLYYGYSSQEALKTIRISLSYRNTRIQCYYFLFKIFKIIDKYDKE